MAPRAFAQIDPQNHPAKIERTRLAGDGSDRKWYRLAANQKTLVMADHGIRTGEADRAEVDAFVDIGRFLYETDAPVPRILAFDRMAGLVILEDLGDENLQTVAARSRDEAALADCYRRVIDELIKMALTAGDTFQTAWTYQSAAYDREMILDKECAYFVTAFLKGYLGWHVAYEGVAPEFERIARGALENALQGFMHRDFQARNILIRNNRCYFIDFQGGRRGPLQYDLASLLIDPYVQLSEKIQHGLLDYAGDQLQRRNAVDVKQFKAGYRYCALTRNLQILGAFGYLSKVKGKSQFETYIRPAVLTLRRNLACIEDAQIPKLRALSRRLVREFEQR
jgi:aminoglycoside/choline kinase family phosphotransferase